MRILLQRGAETQTHNNDGCTPLQNAVKNRHGEVKSILEAHVHAHPHSGQTPCLESPAFKYLKVAVSWSVELADQVRPDPKTYFNNFTACARSDPTC